MRKLLSLIACLAILMPVAAPPAYAAWPVNADCDHFAHGNYFGSLFNSHNVPSWITSVYAQMYGDTGRFQSCTNPLGLEISGTLQWVAIEAPGTSPNHVNIIQLGMIKCGINYTENRSNSPCYPGRNNTLRYFYAYGHEDICELDPGIVYPYPIDLGPVPLVGVPPGPGYHDFQITRSRTNAFYYFFIDGVAKPKSIPEYDLCWANNPSTTRASWSVERWDPGDGFGGAGPAWFQNMKFAHDLNSLQQETWPGTASCNLDPEFYCATQAPDKFGFYTVQQ